MDFLAGNLCLRFSVSPGQIIENRKYFLFYRVRAMEIYFFKQYYGVRTLCKTSKTD